MLGLELFPWQRWLLIHALELRRDGRFRFRTVLVMVARQNGKTTIVELKILFKLFVLGVQLVISTAQDLDQAEESWAHGVEIAESIPELAEHVGKVVHVNGKKTLTLTSRGRWKIKASTRRGGRGLSGDDVNLDELREHTNWQSWSAVTKSTMARPRAQVWAYSNAGDDTSVVLNTLQEKGRAASAHPRLDPSFGHFEYSAPEDCAPDDEAFWPMSNPSLGYPGGVDLEALRSAQRTDPDPTWRTECLCQRVPSRQPAVIPVKAWDARAGAAGRPDRAVAFAITASWPSGEFGCVSVAGRLDAEWLVQVAARRRGTDWVVEYVKERVARHEPVAVVIDPSNPAGHLIPDLEAAGVSLMKLTTRQNAYAAARFRAAARGEPEPADGDGDEVVDVPDPSGDAGDEQDLDEDAPAAGVRLLRHFGQHVLTRAVRAAQTRPVGNVWVWAVRDDTVDVAPLEGVSQALYGATTRELDDYDLTESVW